MVFNVTIIIQIINFWLVYFILSRFLLRPAVAQLTDRETYVKQLKRKTELKQQDIAGLETQKQIEIRLAQSRFQELIRKPHLLLVSKLQKLVPLLPRSWSFQQAEDLTTKIAQVVVDRFRRV